MKFSDFTSPGGTTASRPPVLGLIEDFYTLDPGAEPADEGFELKTYHDEETPLESCFSALIPLNKEILPCFVPSSNISDRVDNGKIKSRKRNRAGSAKKPILPQLKRSRYQYDTPKLERVRGPSLPDEENWSFALLERHRKAKLPKDVFPVFLGAPDSYSELGVLPILRQRDMG